MSRLEPSVGTARTRLRPMSADGARRASLTSDREQLQRVSAIARTAANIASRASLESMLSVMANEIQETDGIVGTQIILVTAGEKKLRMMGSAGFTRHPEFFDTLVECRQRGAPLATYAVLDTGMQAVYADRKAEMLGDSRWAPMHAYISEIEWKDFIATPFGSPEGIGGVINCYISPHAEVGSALCRFLEAMAEQAALAVDYHQLMERDRSRVRRDEQDRIARDLHDAVIQNMFAININANVIESLIRSSGSPPEAASKARDIQHLATTVQNDLRAIIRQLRPSVVAELGFAEAVDSFCAATSRRFGVPVSVVLDVVHRVDPAMADDCYYVVVEAVHNAVKHSGASRIDVFVGSHPSGALSATVSDDGIGMAAQSSQAGYGMASMRHRLAQWSGVFEVRARLPSGTVVTAHFMSPAPIETRSAR